MLHTDDLARRLSNAFSGGLDSDWASHGPLSRRRQTLDCYLQPWSVEISCRLLQLWSETNVREICMVLLFKGRFEVRRDDSIVGVRGRKLVTAQVAQEHHAGMKLNVRIWVIVNFESCVIVALVDIDTAFRVRNSSIFFEPEQLC